jgi:hypothetical protein
MAREAFGGFEASGYNTTAGWIADGFANAWYGSYATAANRHQDRFGNGGVGYAYGAGNTRNPTAARLLRPTVRELKEVWYRAAWYQTDTALNRCFKIAWYNDTTELGSARFYDDHQDCEAYTSTGSLVASSSTGAWVSTRYHVVEVHVYLDDSAGIIEIFVDDDGSYSSPVASFSGDTKPGADSTITHMALGLSAACVIDDWAINSTTMRYDNESGGPFTVDELIHAGAKATGVLTLAGQPNDGDQVDINGQTYTFKDPWVDAADNVDIGASASVTIDNLIAAITGGAGEGTAYGTGTVTNTDVTASAGAGDTMDATAINYGSAGNSITTTDPTDTSGNLDWANATLTGGTGSGATAYLTILEDAGSTGVLVLHNWNGTAFVNNEEITGASSGATADVDAPDTSFVNGFEPNSWACGGGFTVANVPNGNGALTWGTACDCSGYIGNAAASTIEGLSPTSGDSYVVSTADGAGALSSATVGDVWQYVTSTWTKIVTGSGGFPPNNTRLVIHTETVTLLSPLTDGSDEGKIANFDGTSLTPSSKDTPTADNAVEIDGTGAVNDGYGLVFSGTVPSGSWTQRPLRLTGSDGNQTDNYQQVDDYQPPNTSDYNYSGTDGQYDTYGLSDLPSSALTVNAVQVLSYASKDGTTINNAKHVVRVNDTDYFGTQFALGTSYADEHEVFNVSPDTDTKWTTTEVDAMEGGFQVKT